VIAVKKFDSIIRPYLTRLKKATDIQVQLAQVKKLVFEHDLTLSDFFRMCINQEAATRSFYNNDAASLSSKAKRDSSPFQFSIPIQQHGFASQPQGGRSPSRFQQNYVTKD
jgi:hypothetical protein